MTADRWRRMEQLYDAALVRDPGERSAFLNQACADDSDLRHHIESMLAAQSADPLLQQPASHMLAQLLAGRSLSPGDQLGPYEIIARIGAGGMGEVWKARDTRLQRLVAIKIPRSRFSHHSESEARAIAALNHPHICQIYDVGPDYLVMEYVEGAPLKGPLPLDRVLTYSIQLAKALDAVHRLGIVHRDLKPGNILLTKSGIKLLDFGLAQSDREEPQSALAGTPPYMPPEQFKESKADPRSDIFAFGCVLYEMATGARAFDAPSIASIGPPALDRLLLLCLAKDPEERWQSSRDLVHQLEWIAAETAPPPNKARFPLPWIAAGILTGALAYWVVDHLSSPPSSSTVRFTVTPPQGVTFTAAGHGTSRISPDGTMLLFLAGSESTEQALWLRRLDSNETRQLTGTEGARFPFWSSDSRHIGFFADGKLKRVTTGGGPPQTICEARDARGGAWHGGADGVIVFAASNRSSLSRVPASGGTPTPLSTLDSARGEISHRMPHFLPDGRHLLYLALTQDSRQNSIHIAQFPSTGRPLLLGRRLLNTSTEAATVDTPGGTRYIVFVREGNLVAQPFDPVRAQLHGDPIVVVPSIDTGGIRSTAAFSVSRQGALIYRNRPSVLRRMAWLNPQGKEIEAVPAGENLTGIALSPDGRMVAGNKEDPAGVHHIWLFDLIRPAPSRFTFEDRSAINPVWSPDGKQIAFALARGPAYDLFRKSVDSRGEPEPLLSSASAKNVLDWSRDGRWILYADGGGSDAQLYALRVSNPQTSVSLGATTSWNAGAKFSPDVRFIAYSTIVSGRPEIFVRSFNAAAPATNAVWQISTSGGDHPWWRSDGRELFYRSSSGMLIAVAPPFDSPRPRELFHLHGAVVTPHSDGRRFLVELPSPALGQQPLHIVLNWSATLPEAR